MVEMFQSASEVEVKKIIMKFPYKSCDSDTQVIWLLKKSANQLMRLITVIINRSMDESVMPLCFKRTNIIPLLKRYGLDKEEMKNYSPISNLRFICKLFEKITTWHIEEYSMAVINLVIVEVIQHKPLS